MSQSSFPNFQNLNGEKILPGWHFGGAWSSNFFRKRASAPRRLTVKAATSLAIQLSDYLRTPEGQRALSGAGFGAALGGVSGMFAGRDFPGVLGSATLGAGFGGVGGHYLPLIQSLLQEASRRAAEQEGQDPAQAGGQ